MTLLLCNVLGSLTLVFLFRILGRRSCFHWQYCAQLFFFIIFLETKAPGTLEITCHISVHPCGPRRDRRLKKASLEHWRKAPERLDSWVTMLGGSRSWSSAAQCPVARSSAQLRSSVSFECKYEASAW